MKNRLTIFSNNNIKKFLKTLFPEYELTFMSLEDISHNLKNTQPNIIILNSDTNRVNFDNLSDNCLVISSLKKNNLISNKNVKLLNIPLSINHIKNKIQSFVQNFKVIFNDIYIDNEKIINIKNNSFCYLTKAELEILICLVRDKVVNKNFIKENILNIKANIRTNSLESHLTRIRKKLKQIETTVNIQSKNDKLLIIF